LRCSIFPYRRGHMMTTKGSSRLISEVKIGGNFRGFHPLPTREECARTHVPFFASSSLNIILLQRIVLITKRQYSQLSLFLPLSLAK
jgi:hypothetical protein